MVFHRKFDTMVFLDFVTLSWFIQNQIKSHAPSPNVGNDTQVIGCDLLG